MGNSVIRIGRKGIRTFAFGDGEPFSLDVVRAYQEWVAIDEGFRDIDGPDEGLVPTESVADYHRTAQRFAADKAKMAILGADGQPIPGVEPLTVTESLEFIRHLRNCYDEMVAFFRPRPRQEPDSPGSSGVELRFSEEPAPPGPTQEPTPTAAQGQQAPNPN